MALYETKAAIMMNLGYNGLWGLLILVGAYDHFAGSGVEFWDTICQTTDELGRRVPAGDLA